MGILDPDPLAIIFLSLVRHVPDLTFFVFVFIEIVLLIFSGLISGSEVAFFSLGEKEIRAYQSSETKSARSAFQLLSAPKRLLATILWVNTLINISIIILFTLFVNLYFNLSDSKILSFFVEIISITLLLVLFGELIPKIYANQNKKKFVGWMAIPLVLLSRIFKPLSMLLVNSTNLIEKRLMKKDHGLTVQDIHNAIDITSEAGKNPEERKILKRIVDFGSVNVKQIMTSRMDVVAYEAAMPFPEILKDIAHNKFSRIPVFKTQPDNIEGILYIKDLLSHIDKEDNFDWVKLLRKPYFVPQNKKIDDLLDEFQKKKVHIAIVVDEYGGFSGIVTLEDILEEVVGEITDEFDEVEEEQLFNKIDDNNYRFSGKSLLTDVEKQIGLGNNFFEKYRGEADTIGGLMIERLGKIPIAGEKVEFENLVFTLAEADAKTVKFVDVKLS